jgi:hypothetical protein
MDPPYQCDVSDVPDESRLYVRDRDARGGSLTAI